ncbi:Protein of unknown function, partial [Gryllus bimaculatus]
MDNSITLIDDLMNAKEHRITGVSNAINPSDAVNKQMLDELSTQVENQSNLLDQKFNETLTIHDGVVDIKYNRI